MVQIIITTIVTSLVSAIVGAIVATIISFIKQKAHEPAERREEEEKNKQALEVKVNLILAALLCLMRKELIHECEKYINRGKITLYGKDSIGKMYKIYHDLGGNGTVTHLYKQAMNLPLVQEED